MITLEEEFRILVNGYYGIYEMDEYTSKAYVLEKLEKYIREFVKENPISNFDYYKVAQAHETISLKEKLQDSLIVLNKIKAPLELSLLVRKRLNEIK